jgi:hypothetical protein
MWLFWLHVAKHRLVEMALGDQHLIKPVVNILGLYQNGGG